MAFLLRILHGSEDEVCIVCSSNGPTNNFSREHVNHGCEIDLGSVEQDLREVSGPYGVRSQGASPLPQIWRGMSFFVFLAVFPLFPSSLQDAVFFHDSSDHLG